MKSVKELNDKFEKSTKEVDMTTILKVLQSEQYDFLQNNDNKYQNTSRVQQ